MSNQPQFTLLITKLTPIPTILQYLQNEVITNKW